jgi:Mg2+/citrate symporter
MSIHVQIIFCYDANLEKTPIPCFNKNDQCRLVNDLIFAIVTTLIPLIIILIFGWMTILNIRSSQNRIKPNPTTSITNRHLPVTEQQQQRIEKRDRFLLKMLLIQVILFGCLTLPFVICRFYITLTMNYSKSEYQQEIDKFVFEVSLLITFIPSGMQFYVNTLSGGYIFRKVLLDIFQMIFQKIKCR